MMMETESGSDFYDWPDILTKTGLGRSTIERMVKAGEFPKPVRLGFRRSAWKKLDYRNWYENRPEVEWRNNAANGESNV